MKKIATILTFSLTFLFLASSLQAEEVKEMEIKPQYKRGDVFRYLYQGESTTRVLGSRKKLTKSKVELLFHYKVITPLGKNALVSFEIEKFKQKSQGQKMTLKNAPPNVRAIFKALSKLKFMVGPGLQVRKIYGLEKLVRPLLKDLPLDSGQRRFVEGLVRQISNPLNRYFSKVSEGGMNKMYRGKRKVGQRLSAKQNIPGFARIYQRVQVEKISKDKKGTKTLHARVSSSTYYSDVIKFFGPRYVFTRGKMKVNEKGIVESFEFTTSQTIRPFVSTVLKNLRVDVPRGYKVTSKGKLTLVKDEKKDKKQGKGEKSAK